MTRPRNTQAVFWKWCHRSEFAARHSPVQRRVGRATGIRPERQRALAELVQKGWTLQEIADALGVTRQCIHAQLRKCPELERTRRAQKRIRRALRREALLTRRAIRALSKSTGRGREILRVVRMAEEQGWLVELLPRRRLRINGTPVAVHCPRTVRAAGANGRGRARYFHIRISHPEWMHIVVFPAGNMRIFRPGELRRSGSLYIPVTDARSPLNGRSGLPVQTETERPAPVRKAA